MSRFLTLFAVVLALLAGLTNLVRRKWLINLVSLAIQYICVFLIIPKTEGLNPALIKLIVGLMSTLIIYLSILASGSLHKHQWSLTISSGELFRGVSGFFLVGLVILAVPWLQKEVFPLSGSPLLMASFGLMLLGLLQLGSKTEPLYVIIGLLTFLSGFELLYASLEFSTTLEALFAAVNLLLALGGAYFITKDLELAK